MNARFSPGDLWKPEPALYRDLSWSRRRRIDLHVYGHILCSRSAIPVLLFVVATEVIVLTLTWQLDMQGWRRDVLRTLAVIILWSWIAFARRRHLSAMFSR